MRAVFIAGGIKKPGGGQDWNLDELIRWGRPPVSEEPATLQDVFGLFQAISKGKKPNG